MIVSSYSQQILLAFYGYLVFIMFYTLSSGSDYEDYCFLGYDIVQFGRLL
jgi:hypothetical protein